MAADLRTSYRLNRRPWWRPRLPYISSMDWDAYRLRALTAGALWFIVFFIFLFGVGTLGAALFLGGLGVAGVIALLIWWRPFFGLVIMVTLAPLHSFLMMLIFNVIESGIVLRLAQGWKELVLIVLLLKAAHIALEERKPPRITFLDLLVCCYALFTVAYILFPSTIQDVTPITKVYGARTDMMFFLTIFLARGLKVTLHQVKILLGIVIGMSLVVALVAAYQVSAPGSANDLFNRLGYTKYAQAQSIIGGEAFAVRQRDAGDLRVTRASSLLLGDLALSFYQLALVPLALGLFLWLRGTKARIFTNIYLLIMIGVLAMTVTRSAILAGIVACAVVLLWRKSVSLALLIGVQLAGALAAMAGILNLTTERLRSLFSPEEASSQARIDTFSRGLEILRQYPWGNGLGTSGTIAQRFAAAGGDTPENWYLQIANEMGIAGALLFAAIAVMLIVMCFRRYSQVRDPLLKAICLGMGGAMIGYAGVGIFLHVWEALTTSMMVCFFVGVALAAPDIERTEEHRTGEPIRT